MGRRVPLPVDVSLHPVLSFSVFLAGMVAAVAMVTTLCGVRFGRRSSEPSKSPSREASKGKNVKTFSFLATSPSQPLPKMKNEFAKIAVSPIATRQEGSESENNPNENIQPTEVKELPLPPSKQLKPMHSYNQNIMTKSASTRDIVATMSMKLPRSFSMARNNNRGDQKEEQCNNQKKKGKFKPEDSVWMKTIILGEKCKVPDDDEVTIYDGKGNRISTYHPKTPTSLPVSRQNSQIDANAIPSQDRTSIHQPRSPFSRPMSRQTSMVDPDAIPRQDRGKAVTKNEGEFS